MIAADVFTRMFYPKKTSKQLREYTAEKSEQPVFSKVQCVTFEEMRWQEMGKKYNMHGSSKYM